MGAERFPSDLDAEKYLPSVTPMVLLFVAGNWSENTSLKRRSGLAERGLCTQQLMLAAAGGWVPSLSEQRVQKTSKKPLPAYRCALHLREGAGQWAFHLAPFNQLFAQSCLKGFRANLLFVDLFPCHKLTLPLH